MSSRRTSIESAERLQQCGLVYHERQSDGRKWIGPQTGHPDGIGRIRVLPLSQTEPQPMMEVRAHGEVYSIPYNFKGGWFDVTSPTGRPLIP